jgi:hypothetical protein
VATWVRLGAGRTQALQHSKPTLTWDADDPARLAVTRRPLTKADVAAMDFAAYLASEDSSLSSESGVCLCVCFSETVLGLIRVCLEEEEDGTATAARKRERLKARRRAQREKYRSLLAGTADTPDHVRQYLCAFVCLCACDRETKGS